MESDVVIQGEGDVGVELGDEVVLEQPDDNLRQSVLVQGQWRRHGDRSGQGEGGEGLQQTVGELVIELLPQFGGKWGGNVMGNNIEVAFTHGVDDGGSAPVQKVTS